MAPALAAGNAVIIKPSTQTSGVAIGVLRLLASCSALPSGILNIITGPGKTVGQAIVEHPGIDMIAFTGDAATGRALMAAAAPTVKKVALELGGKSPMVVCADANLDRAIPELVSAALTTTSGQICTAPSRLVIEKSIHAQAVERLRAAVSSIRVGSGLDANSQMGPLANREQMQKVNRYIELGRKEARLVAGGVSPDKELARGSFVMPAVFDDVRPESPLVRDEVFGPVLVLQSFEGDHDALRVANQTPYGLASAVWTENLNRAWRLARGIKAGTVWVNTYNRFYPETEVGGYKASGVGRMAGFEGLFEFTQTKHINFDGRGAEAGVGKTGA
jgi:betaine-aldehyde dehydrogenase